MPRDQHYRQAGQILSNVLGADAAEEQQAYRESIEHMAKLFELAEAYQNHLDGVAVVKPEAGPNKSRAA